MNKPTGSSTAEWQRLDSAHYLHPFTDYKALAARGARIITHADGVYIHTSVVHRTVSRGALISKFWVETVTPSVGEVSVC